MFENTYITNNIILRNEWRYEMYRKIPGFNYTISVDGTVYNSHGVVIAQSSFKNRRYVRLYKLGKRHTLSVEKLINELFEEPPEIPLYRNEKAFRYENTNYFITNRCRVYNSKFRRWLKVIYKNGYPVANLSVNGKVETVSLIKFLKCMGGKYE